MSDLAYQATWLSRPADAVRVLEHARSRSRTPAARSLLDVCRARACAVLQDRLGTQRALASAETELDRMRPQDTPPVVSWMSMADVNADAGRCWLDLGDPGRADAAIGAGLGKLDPRRSRTKAVFLTYRRKAHSTAEMPRPPQRMPAPLSTLPSIQELPAASTSSPHSSAVWTAGPSGRWSNYASTPGSDSPDDACRIPGSL